MFRDSAQHIRDVVKSLGMTKQAFVMMRIIIDHMAEACGLHPKIHGAAGREPDSGLFLHLDTYGRGVPDLKYRFPIAKRGVLIAGDFGHG